MQDVRVETVESAPAWAMTSFRRMATMLFLLSATGLAYATDRCDFDSAALARQLVERAARTPGATFDRRSKSFSWHLPTGSTVVLWHGGCVHLATTLTVRFAKGKPLAEDRAIETLTKALGEYWSVESAQDFDRAWRGHKFGERYVTKRGAEYTASETEGFLLGANLSITPDEVSLTWEDA